MANGGLWGDGYGPYPPPTKNERKEIDHTPNPEAARKMGDHRVTIRIMLEFHGHKADSGEMYLNWWSGGGGELPGGARDWLQDQHAKGMRRFENEQEEYQAKAKAVRDEERDKETYARLYAKFGGKDPSQQRRD